MEVMAYPDCKYSTQVRMQFLGMWSISDSMYQAQLPLILAADVTFGSTLHLLSPDPWHFWLSCSQTLFQHSLDR